MSDYRKAEKRRPLVSGIIWLCLGLWWLWIDADWMPPVSKSWPIILVIIGLAIMINAFVRKPKTVIHHDQTPLN